MVLRPMMPPPSYGGFSGGLSQGFGFALGSGIFRFFYWLFRPFFPYHIYDWFVFTSLLLVLFDIFIVKTTNLFILSRIVFVIAWVLIFSISESSSVTDFVKRLILYALSFGIMFLFEVKYIPLLAYKTRSNLILSMRTLFPPWFLFAIVFDAIRCNQLGLDYEQRRFYKRYLTLYIIFLIFVNMSWISYYIGLTKSYLKIPSIKIKSAEIGLYKLKLIDYFKKAKDGFLYLVNGSFIKDQLQPFVEPPSEYQPGESSFIGVSIDNIVPPGVINIVGNDKPSFSMLVRFKKPSDLTCSKYYACKRFFENEDMKARVFIKDLESGKELNDYSCKPKEISMKELMLGKIISCTINSLDFSEDSNVKLIGVGLEYDFFTIGERIFYFIDKSTAFELLNSEEDVYLKEFNEYPSPTQNTGGPILVGIGDNGEMTEFPILYDKNEDSTHLIVINIKEFAPGNISSLNDLYLLLPKGMNLDDKCILKKTGTSDCLNKLGITDNNIITDHYNCYHTAFDEDTLGRIFTRQIIKRSYSFYCEYKLTNDILGGNYKAAWPIYFYLSYKYNTNLREISIQKVITSNEQVETIENNQEENYQETTENNEENQETQATTRTGGTGMLT